MANAVVQVDIRAAVSAGFTQATKQASAGLRVFQQQTQQLSQQQQVIRGRLRETRNQMSQMRGEGVGLAAAGYGAAKLVAPAVQLEKSMADNLAVAMENGEALSKTSGAWAEMNAEVRRLGATTEKTSLQAAAGLNKLLMAGFEASEATKALEGTLALSTVGNIDSGVSADILSNIMGSYKAGAEETMRFADMMSYAITTTNTDVQMLGEAFKYVGPIANKFGTSAETTTAMLGLLGNIGIQGSQGGTSLRQIMTRFADPPKEAKEALEALGVSTVDAQGDLRALEDIFKDISKATEGMASGKQLEVFKSLYGQIALAAGAELTSVAGSGELEMYLAKFYEQFQGTTEKIRNTKLDTSWGDLTLMTSALSGAAIAIGTQLLPSIRAGAQALTAMFSGVAQLATEYPGLTRVIVMTVAGLFLFKTAMFAARIASLLFGTGLLKSRLATIAFKKAVVGAKVATAVLGRTMSVAMLANPIGLAAAGIAAGVFLIYKYWGPVKAFFQGIWSGISETVGPAISRIKTAFEPLAPAIGMVADGVGRIWSVFSGLLSPVQSSSEELDNFLSAGQAVGQVIGPAIEIALNATINAIETFVSAVTGVVETFALLFSGKPIEALKRFGQAIGDTFAGITETIASVFGVELDLSGWATAPIAAIKSAWQGFDLWSLVGLGGVAPNVKALLTAPFTTGIAGVKALFVGFSVWSLLGLGGGDADGAAQAPNISAILTAPFTTAKAGIDAVFNGFGISKLLGIDGASMPDISGLMTAPFTLAHAAIGAVFSGFGLASLLGLDPAPALQLPDLAAAFETAKAGIVSVFAGFSVSGLLGIDGLSIDVSLSAVSARFETFKSGIAASFASFDPFSAMKATFDGVVGAIEAGIGSITAMIGSAVQLTTQAADKVKGLFSKTAQEQALAGVSGAVKGGLIRNSAGVSQLQDVIGRLRREKMSTDQAVSELTAIANDQSANLQRTNRDELLAAIEQLATASAAAEQVKASAAPTAASVSMPTPALSLAEVQALKGSIVEVNSAAQSLSAGVQTAVQSAEMYLAGVNWHSHGAKIMTTLISGIKSKSGELKSTISGAFADSRRLMPSSDAKEGPFSTLTRSGMALMTTLGQGVSKAGVGALGNPLRKAFGQANGMMSVSPKFGTLEGGFGSGPVNPVRVREGFVPSAPGGTPAGGRGQGGAISFAPNISINVNGAGGDATSIAEQVQRAVAEEMERLMGDVRTSLFDGA